VANERTGRKLPKQKRRDLPYHTTRRTLPEFDIFGVNQKDDTGYSGEEPSLTNFMDKNSFLNEVASTTNVSSVFMYADENQYLSKWQEIKRDVDYFVYQSELKSAAKSVVFGLLCSFAAHKIIEDSKHRNALIGFAGISGATVYYKLATFRPG
jgi:hypothetical protein